MTARRVEVDAFDAEAELVERLGVLLAAGVPASAAWRHLAADGSPLAQAVTAGETGPGEDVVDRIIAAADSAGQNTRMRSVAAVWQVATVAGAPLAATLSALADTLRDLAEGARERTTALAGPRATSRIVLALPPLGLAFGALLGLDTLGVLFGSPIGWGCLLSSAVLLLVGQRWSGRMLDRAALGPAAPGLALELVAIGLASGMPPDRALGLAAGALDRAGLTDDTDRSRRHLDFARGAGVPASGLLRSAARAERRRARADAARRAQELGTRLVLPLGVCILPAFVLVGVIPAGIAIVSSTALFG